ncbi:MAG: putative DNA binding domain-containing protein [Oscillospiraceae bacterium]|nr:putative DNA binding domain-containing protein [Oscillospiraceae bacterium]
MIKDFDVILSKGEGYSVEFKETADKSIPNEVCAFANASGGRIFIGVTDKGDVVGTDVSNEARSRLQDSINKIEPQLNVDLAIHGKVIEITVPEGSSKPYSCPNGFYLRSGPNSQKLNRSNLIEFFKREEHIHYDQIVRKDLPLSEKFNDKAYSAYIRTANISEVLDRDNLLINMGCADYYGDTLCFTNAGALFFRINDEDVKFRHAGIVCGLYKGIDKAYVIDAKEFNGDIISNIEEAITYLKRHLNLSYKIETTRRENILELPEKALREAVINAACHRLYYEKGARISVEIYDDRVEVTSPGGVCKGITAKNFGKISIARNSVVASMLCRIGYIEQMGTGIERMRGAAKEADVAAPEFELDDFFKVTFKRSRHSNVLSTVTSDRQAIGSDRRAIENVDRTSLIMKYLAEYSSGTSADFAELLNLSPQRVRVILLDLAQRGLIEKHSDKRYAYYTAKIEAFKKLT